MIACTILIAGVMATTHFTNQIRVDEGSDLEETGQKVMRILNNQQLMTQIILDEPNLGSKLRSLLETLLLPNTLYNLTLRSELSGNQLTQMTNIIDPSSISKANAITLVNIATVSLPLTKAVNSQLDVILIIDISGTMYEPELQDPQQRSKLYFAKEAAKAFIDQLNMTSDRVGITSFSDNGTLNSPLTNDFAGAKLVIDGLQGHGLTNMGQAIEAANDEFASHKRTSATLAFILLTDGVANRPCSPQYARQYALSESLKAKACHVAIFTIGLGRKSGSEGTAYFDESFLQQIQTDGYYYSPSATQLGDIYMAIVQDLLFTIRYDIISIRLTLVRSR